MKVGVAFCVGFLDYLERLCLFHCLLASCFVYLPSRLFLEGQISKPITLGVVPSCSEAVSVRAGDCWHFTERTGRR